MKKGLLLIILFFGLTNLANSQNTKTKMYKKGGVWTIPGTVNGLKFDFIFDTGAADVLVSSDIFSVMLKQGTITENDILGKNIYEDASGNTTELISFNIKKIIVGGWVVRNVKAAVSNSNSTPLLLGQAFLSRFPSFTQTKDGYLILNNNESVSTSNSTSTESSSTRSSYTSSGDTYSILSYDLNNNIPLNIRYSWAIEDGTGIYIGCGFKFGKSPTSAGIYQLENGQAVMYDGDALIGSFGPKLEEGRSIYSVNIGVNRHLFWNIWWSGGLGWERNLVVEKREHFYDHDNNGSNLPEEYWDIEWLENKDESSHLIFVETDVYLKIWAFAVKYGISYKHAAINSVVGVGFAF